MTRELVFVYGTLKEGYPNFATNAGVRVEGAFRTVEALPLYLVGERRVPWLVQQPGVGFRVAGQMFEVDAATLAAMDRLEGTHESDGYRRVRIDVEVSDHGDAPLMSVYAYLKSPSQLADGIERIGPLEEYTLAHAALYRRRAA
jgi:gamma-glutamylaminecyclotransferase